VFNVSSGKFDIKPFFHLLFKYSENSEYDLDY